MTGKLFTELQKRGKSMFKRKRRVIGKTDFGALLAKLRIDADENLSCQAKKLRVSQSLLSMITYGSRSISSDFVLKVFRTYKNFIKLKRKQRIFRFGFTLVPQYIFR